MIRTLCVVLLLAGCSPEKRVGRGGFVYALERDGVSFYLGGTMHALRDSDRPSDPAYTEVLGKVGRLVCEVDGTADAQAVFQAWSEGGKPASELLAPGEKARLAAVLGGVGIGEEIIARAVPGVVVAAAVFENYERLGALPEHGMDARLRARAAALGVRVIGLEDAVGQARAFAGLSDGCKLAMLRHLIEHGGEYEAHAAEVLGSWIAGDPERFEVAVFEGARDNPEFMEVVHGARNKRWQMQVTGMLADGVPTFVAVGAAHLFGEHGLLALFRGSGWEITRIDRGGLPRGGDGA